MITIEDLNNKNVGIKDFNSTYLTLEFGKELIRFDFTEKKEAFIKQKNNGVLRVYNKHPLLLNYNENNLEVYINSSPKNVESFIEDVENTINKFLKGWRSWKNYIEESTGINYEVFTQNVKNGRGKFLKAPFSIVDEIEKVCEKHNVKIKSFGDKKIYENKLIMVNNQFVIAKDFKLNNNL